MTGRCKDCKHWGAGVNGPQTERFGYGSNQRRCETLEDSVLLQQDEAYGAQHASALGTAPDFGCVLFAPSASEPAHQDRK